jgi:sialate O-acetylesterase
MKVKIKSTLLFCFGLKILNAATAQIKLPQIIRDSMILQRDTKIIIWGWASKGEKITVTLNRKAERAVAGNDGRWKITFPPMKAGGPYTIVITGKNKIILRDILIGDIWLCAGQSNMEHQMKLHSVFYPEEIANANYPEIRQFKIPNVTNLTGPQKDLPGGSWKWADSENVKDFSAVAYFFAKALYQKYHVPIGIINASWGGIPIESMMSEESLQSFPDILKTI